MMKNTCQSSRSGLEGVIAFQTRLSEVDGEAGRLLFRGYPAESIASLPHEALIYLLLEGKLPSAAELAGLGSLLADGRRHAASLGPVLSWPESSVSRPPMDALRLALCTLCCSNSELTDADYLGALPSLLAISVRQSKGLRPVKPRADLSRAQAFLYELEGTVPGNARSEALSIYWNTVSEHGCNASTFVARCIASTQSDTGSALEGALGALKGPLHGGAPGPVLQSLLQLMNTEGPLDRVTERWVRKKVSAGERIMGFGHRVYRVRDPRAVILSQAAEQLLGGGALYAAAQVHEQVVLRTLKELKPARALATNVEFYTALLLHGIGLEPGLFTPVFALGRCAGWLAHLREQRQTGRLIRPRARYIGPRGLELPRDMSRAYSGPARPRGMRPTF